MIPKIAHFHWEGQPINWLRMMGIYTFIRLNPRWEVRLIRTPEHVREKKLPEFGNEADWAWLEALYYEGGFAMATDTVFVNPIPEQWCNADMCVCTDGTDNPYHCCFGSVPGTPFLRNCIEACEMMCPENLGYQAMGVELLVSVSKKMGGMRNMVRRGVLRSFFDMPRKAMCPVHWSKVESLWEKDETLPVTEETIGVTWFGGAVGSASREWDVPNKYADSAIVRLALEHT